MKYGRLTFTARIEKNRYGIRRGYVLLVRIMHDGKVVADHTWIPYEGQITQFRPGNLIEFEAEVREYLKGYCGTNPKKQLRKPLKTDYHLVKISDIKLVRRWKNDGLG